MVMKSSLSILLAVSALLLTSVLSMQLQADPPSEGAASDRASHLTPLMRLKLEKSKAILEGLTLEDFDQIAANARSLKLVSTEAGWNVIQTREYAEQSRDFQRATELVAEAAEEKDVHRAAMGYVAMTVHCVECHSYMRKHRNELVEVPRE
jgi:hypothetical protein